MAKNTNLNTATSSLEDTIGFPEKEQKSEPPKLSFHAVMTACLQGHPHGHSKTHQNLSNSEWLVPKPLKASQKNVEQLQRKRMDGMVENTYLQESLELLSQEAAGWKQRAWEQKGKNAWKLKDTNEKGCKWYREPAKNLWLNLCWGW